MGMTKLAEKVAEYNARLENGTAKKIKPGHVQKILAKLHKKSEELQADIANARSPDRRSRLERKLEIATAHINRAEWLLKELG